MFIDQSGATRQCCAQCSTLWQMFEVWLLAQACSFDADKRPCFSAWTAHVPFLSIRHSFFTPQNNVKVGLHFAEGEMAVTFWTRLSESQVAWWIHAYVERITSQNLVWIRLHFLEKKNCVLGRPRRSRNGLMESCTCRWSGGPPHHHHHLWTPWH